MSDEISLSRSEVEAAWTQLSPADLKRIKIKAHTYSKALTYLTAEDLIQEALIS